MEKLTLKIYETWPFRMMIMQGNQTIVEVGRIAYSTESKTLEDVRNAVGFKPDERDRIIRIIAEQEACLTEIVTACNVYESNQAEIKRLREACKMAEELLSCICEVICKGNPPPHGAEAIALLRAALAPDHSGDGNEKVG